MSNDSTVQEILDRVRRTETRLMSLGNRLGFDLKDEAGVHVYLEQRLVDLDSMDVSVSSVVRLARRAGLLGKITVSYRKLILSEDFRV